MKKMKKFLWYLCLCLWMIPLVSAESDSPPLSLSVKKKVIIGDSAAFPPFIFRDKDGKLTGFSLELMQNIAENMGFEIEIRMDEWETVKKKLLTGEVECVLGMTRTKEREGNYDFSTPYFILDYDLFILKGSPRKTLEEYLKGKLLVYRGDSFHEWMNSRAGGKNDSVTGFQTFEEIFRALETGEYDAACLPRMQTYYLLSEYGYSDIRGLQEVFFSKEFGFAVKKGNKALLSLINQGMSIAEKTGVLRNLYQKWFSISTVESRKFFFHQHQEIILGVLALALIILLRNLFLRKKIRIQSEDLDQYKAQLIMAFEGAELGGWELNLKTGIFHLNDQLLEIFGYRGKGMKPHFSVWESLIHPEYQLYLRLSVSTLFYLTLFQRF